MWPQANFGMARRWSADWGQKEVVGIVMSVLDGAEVTHGELDDLTFEADGELETALNEAYVKLREFANDQSLRLSDPKRDQSMRSELKDCLDNIVRASNS
jgi:hypothetical protein